MKTQKQAAGSVRPRPRRAKVKPVQLEYLRYFTPAPAPAWRNDDDNYSLEQPSPLKWVPSETTYGIGTILNAVPANA